MMGTDFENPFGIKTPKGELKMMSAILDGAVFPGTQGGPLEHVIAAKAVAFGEALQDSFTIYGKQVISNAQMLAKSLVGLGYNIVSGGTDNHCILIDLRNKNITGKEADAILGKVHITANKNMVPGDTQSPMITSGIRLGTPAITTRGLVETDMEIIASLIDQSIVMKDNETSLKEVSDKVKKLMSDRPLFI
jgi:glycine hydroxymethyltransferase